MNDGPNTGVALQAHCDLLWIVDHWVDLIARLRPGGGNALSGMVTTSNGHPLPIDVHVSDLMREIEDEVARHYARVLLAETDWAPKTSAMPKLLREVADRYGHFTSDPDSMFALTFCDDAHDYRERVRKTLERPPAPTYVGPCQHRGEDGAGCEGELYVREGRDAGTCKVCGTAFTLAEQREYLDRELEARLMTASEIGRALKILGTPVPSATIRTWVTRGRLAEAVDDSGLYRLADAKVLAERGRVSA